MADARSFFRGWLKSKISREILGTPFAVSLGAGKDAGAGCVEDGAVNPTPAVFHPRFKRARHLPPTLLTKCLIFGSFAGGGFDTSHDFGFVCFLHTRSRETDQRMIRKNGSSSKPLIAQDTAEESPCVGIFGKQRSLNPKS